MKRLEFLANSRNNKRVSFEPLISHAATHMADTPNLKELAIAVIQRTDVSGDYMQFHTDTGTPAGMCDLVSMNPLHISRSIPDYSISESKCLEREEA